jgi:colanic acid/amylovoran biosynthesis glycosyltransferase
VNQGQKKNHLIVFLSNFPYGFGEPYFASELPYLVQVFDKVSVVPADLIPGISTETMAFPLPVGVKVLDWKSDFLLKFNGVNLVKGMISIWFWKELKWMLFELKPKDKKLAFKVALMSWIRGQSYANYLQATFLDQDPNENTLFYSYWCTDVSLGMALLKAKGRKETMVSRIHAWDLYFDRDKSGYLPFRRSIFSNLDAIFSISGLGKNYLLGKLGQDLEGRIRIARLGSDHIPSKCFVTDKKVLRILSVSKIIPLKRIELLVKSLAIAQESISLVWHHLGGEDAALQAFARAQLWAVESRFLPMQGKEAYYKHLSEHPYDLFVNLSTNEGLPVTMMEAMSLGIPVLATDVGAVSEIVQDGENGWLIPVDSSPEKIAKCLVTIARLTAEENEQFRQNAIAKWENDFNSAKNYLEFARTLLNF